MGNWGKSDLCVDRYLASVIQGMIIKTLISYRCVLCNIQGVSFILSYLKWLKCAVKNDNWQNSDSFEKLRCGHLCLFIAILNKNNMTCLRAY